ncbi:SET and MYND domain-containing protein 5 [Blastocladiella emersonii ATCC 22665]|nr:SET and MYND domain-containing protein 5 [Blastocladiella emersonii ATCC 22665]
MDGIQVQWISDHKERGVLAARDFAEGDVIFEEAPQVSAQYLYNSQFFPACEYCQASLEAPVDMARRLAGTDEIPALWGADELPGLPRLPCQHGCEDVVYCSETCRSRAWDEYHRILCVGVNPVGDASDPRPVLHQIYDEWRSFHFPPETATIGLVVKMVAMMAATGDDDLWRHYKADHTNDALQVAAKFLDAQFADRIDTFLCLFQRQFAGHVDVTRDLFLRLLTAVALNGQGVGTSAFEAYERTLRDMAEAAETNADADSAAMVEAALDQVDVVRAMVDDFSAEFTHAEGTGLYRVHAMLNHACDANAQIEFLHNRSTLAVRATRPIRMGEEVTISYMHFHGDDEEEADEEEEAGASSSSHHHGHDHDHDEDDGCCDSEVDVSQRRAALREYYLFECQCAKCVAEEQAQH